MPAVSITAAKTAADQAQPADERPHLPGLDGVRGVAIAMVLCLHFAQILQLRPTGAVSEFVLRLASFGWTGVNLFFVLSGFLITGILIEAKGKENYFLSFYARRALRIWPVYFAFLAVSFLVLPRLGIGGGPNWEAARQHQIWYWLHQTNIMMALRELGPRPEYPQTLYWSLAAEEQFYLVWPAVVLLCSRATLQRVCLWGAAASLLSRIIGSASGMPHDAIYVITPMRLDGLLLGAYAALRIRDADGGAPLRRVAPAIAAVSLAVIVGIQFATGRFDYADAITCTVGDTVIATLSGALVLGAAFQTPGSFGTAFWGSRFLRMLGRYSYAMYIIHIAVIRQFNAMVPFDKLTPVLGSLAFAQVLYFAAVMAEVILLGAASWFFFERPILSLKRFVPYGAR